MSRLNKIILIGTIQSALETKVTTAGQSITSFTIEAARPAAENAPAQSDIITIVAWEALSVRIQSLSVGDMVLVEGSIRTRNYENNEGQRIYVTEVEARDIKSFSGSLPQASSDISSVITPTAPSESPITEAAKSETPFDFNDAIKQETDAPVSELSAQLGEDVPF